jgi:PAS domain S-box-containing protein
MPNLYQHVIDDSEIPFSASMSPLSTGLWCFNIQSRISKWTPSLYHLLGREVGDYPSGDQGALPLVHPDDQELVHREMSLGISSIGHQLEYFCRMKHSDGRWLTFLCKGWAERDEDGRPVRVYGSLTKIRSFTQNSLVSESDAPPVAQTKVLNFLAGMQNAHLHEVEYRLKMALANSGLGVFDWDLRTDRVGWDRQHEHLWGYGEGQFSGDVTAVFSRVHPDDMAQFMELLELAKINRRPFTCRFRVVWPDESQHWIESRGEFAYDRDGTALRMFGTVCDVTSQHSTQLELSESEARFRSLFEHLPIAYQSLDINGLWLDANDAVADLLGYESASQMIGQDFSEHFDDELRDRFQSNYELFKRDNSVDRLLPLRKKDGSRIYVEVTGRIQRDANGRFIRTHCILLDATARHNYLRASQELNRELELQVRQRTEQLESALMMRSQFLAHMSHEIRNPMNIIGINTHLMSQSSLSGAQREMIDRTSRAISALGQFLDEILEYAKLERGEVNLEKNPFDLGELLRHSLEQHQTNAMAKHIDLVSQFPQMMPVHLSGDVRRINQILQNLIGNAIKFTTTGSITVKTTLEEISKGLSRVHFEVIDTGCGIAQLELKDLFQPFKQANNHHEVGSLGTGLGLSICKGLVSLMRGEIGVSSTPGIGSRFWFWLPLEHSDASVHITHEEDSSFSLKTLRFLLIDDEPLNLEALNDLLATQGANCISASSGEEGIEELGNDPDGFDGVLLDIQMPIMDGLEVSSRIRNSLGLVDLPIIAVSAGITLEQQERALASGINHFVKKPINPDELVRVLHKYCMSPDERGSS